MNLAWELPTLLDTERLGAALGRACPQPLREPRLLYLSGELGAGKTTLTAAMLRELGVQDAVRSPSFALIEIYPLPALQVVHVDLYRLHDAVEVEQLGLRDQLAPGHLLLVEWPERAHRVLPVPDVELRLEFPAELVSGSRHCRVNSRTEAGEEWLTRTEQILGR